MHTRLTLRPREDGAKHLSLFHARARWLGVFEETTDESESSAFERTTEEPPERHSSA
jgi:hypothetical protein